MTERKPVEISDEDWANTPSAVRGFVSQSIGRLEQLEAQLQTVSPLSQTTPTHPPQPPATETSPAPMRPRRTLNRLASTALAIGIAVVAQGLLANHSLWDGLLLYLVAVLLFVWSFRGVPGPALRQAWTGFAKPARVRQGVIQPVGLIVLVGAVLVSLLAYQSFGQNSSLPLAWNFYLYSLAGLIIGVLLLTPQEGSWRLWPQPVLLRWLLVGVFLLAIFLRLWQLDSVPFGTWYDEAISGLQGVRWNTEPAYRPQFEENNSGQHIFLFAMMLRWFGQSTESIRLASVLFGLAGVVMAFLFGQELRGPRFGLALAFFIAVARWHINFSRIAMPGIDTPFTEFLTLFFLLRLWRYGRLRDAAWAGMSLGLGLSFYSAFRLFVLALGIFALLAGLVGWRGWWTQRKERQWWADLSTRLVLFVMAVWLTALPVIHFAMENPTAFWARVQKTSLLTKRDESDLGKALWRNTQLHLLMFNFEGDRNGRHNLPGAPMLDPAMGVLFVLGLSLALTRLRQPANLFFLILFSAGLLGGILSLDFEAPQSLRSIAVLPAVGYFCAVALLALGQRAAADLRPWPDWWLAGPAVVLGGLIFYLNANTYFNRQATEFASWNAFSTAESIVGQRMAQLGPDYIFYLSPFFNEHPTIRFLSPDTTDRRQLLLPDALPIRQPADRPAALFIHPDDQWVYEAARRLYPSAVFKPMTDLQGSTPVVYSVELPRQVISLSQGAELRYWPNQTWAGPPQTSLPVNNIELTWPDASAFAVAGTSAAAGQFSAEWAGVLYAPEYGSYQFVLQAPAAASLEIDEQPPIVIETGGQQMGELMLAQGNHRLRLRALGGLGPVNLQWQRPGQNMELVPAWVLYRPPVTNNGLLGNYYANSDWEGPPALARIDPFLDLYFHLTPLPRPYSAEWQGILAVPQAGTYGLGLRAVDEAQLYLDEQLLVKTEAPDRYTQTDLVLAAGSHDLRLRFKDTSGRSRLHLFWQPPGQVKPVAIPTYYLWPSRNSYVEPALAELPPPEPSPAQPGQPPLSALPGAGQVTLISTGFTETPLNQPRGIAIGPNGWVYLADTGNRRLLILDSAGGLVAQLTGGAQPFEELSDLAVDGSGQLYALDAGAARLSVFDAQGNFLNDVPAPVEYLGRSRGMFVDNQNRLWLANTPANRVAAFNPGGNILLEIPISDDASAQPVDVAVTADSNIYITDAILDQLLLFGANGQLQTSWPIPHSTSIDGAHLAAGPDGYLYLTIPEEGQVLRLTLSGETAGSWELLQPNGQKMRPVGVAVDPQGRIWVADSLGGNVAVITPE